MVARRAGCAVAGGAAGGIVGSARWLASAIRRGQSKGPPVLRGGPCMRVNRAAGALRMREGHQGLPHRGQGSRTRIDHW